MPKSKQEKNAMLLGVLVCVLTLAFIPPAYNPVNMIADLIKGMGKKKTDGLTERR